MRCSQVARANRTVTVCCSHSASRPARSALRSVRLRAAVASRRARAAASFHSLPPPARICRLDTSKTKKSPSWCVYGNCRVAGTDREARGILKDFQNFLNSDGIMDISSFVLFFFFSYLSWRKLHTRPQLEILHLFSDSASALHLSLT